MKFYLVFTLALFFGAGGAFAQVHKNSGPLPTPPRDIVEEVWTIAVSGELLTAKGWSRASGYYVKPQPMPRDKSFDVISNYYGYFDESINGDKAEVYIGFTDAGRVGSNLRYTPPPKSPFYKTNMGFSLVLTPTYIRMFGPDGKTEIERKPTHDSAWEIVDPVYKPWTTVNTAIRYVLEMRNKSTDPVIKKNADETIASLMKWP